MGGVTRGVGYSDQVVDEVCERIADGDSLADIFGPGRASHLPSKQTWFNWLANPEHKQAADMYALALEIRATIWLEETIAIADDGRNDWVERESKNGTYIALDKEHVMRSRLRVEARWKLAEQMSPKRYARRLEVTGAEGTPLVPNVTVGPSQAALGAAIAVMLGGADNAGHNDNPAPRSSDTGA